MKLNLDNSRRLIHQAIFFLDNLIGAPWSSTLTDPRPHASSAIPVAQGIWC